MAERERKVEPSASNRTAGVRRNLFHQHLSRRPTSASTTTFSETLRLDIEHEAETSDIVIRNKDGDLEIANPLSPALDVKEEEGSEEVDDQKEKQRLVDAIKHHQRDRNRAPSEPLDLLEDVKASLREKVAALAEDNWLYEPEEDTVPR